MAKHKGLTKGCRIAGYLNNGGHLYPANKIIKVKNLVKPDIILSAFLKNIQDVARHDQTS